MKSKITELQKKRQLFIDAIKKDKKPDRIPLLDLSVTWRITNSGYTLKQAMYDYDIMYKIVCDYHEKYQFDTYFDIGLLNPMRVYDAVGGKSYKIDNEKGFINYLDQSNMDVKDYNYLINEGYMKYFIERLFVNKFNFNSKEDAYKRIKNAAKELHLFQEFGNKINKQFNDIYEVPGCAFGRYDLAPEVLFWGMRGMKGISIDMRRNPELLEKGLEALKPYINANFSETVKNQPKNDSYVFDFKLTMLCHNLMNEKQFERFYLPYLKEYAEVMAKNDKLGWIFVQGTADKIYDYLKELPKGHFAVLIEQGNIIDIKKKIGDKVAIVGGISTDLLNNGTKKECIDHVRWLIENVGYDGSLIISPEKMLSFANDANPENLLAINNFVKNYQL